jgi:ECF transporter S component (folate family)
MSVYTNPFSAAFWSDAKKELGSMKKLTFAALMIALCVMLSYIPSVPLWGGAKLTWGFLARSMCAWVCGPVLGAAFGVAEDLLSFFLTGGGGYPFFPGYTLTTVLGNIIYALFFYRQEMTLRRIFCAKVLTNVQNVLLGALWSSILYGKAYLVIAGGSAIKNLIMLPFQTLILAALFSAVMPVLGRMGLVPKQKGRMKW